MNASQNQHQAARAKRLSETVRTTRLSELCYAHLVRKNSSWNFWIEITTAVLSSTAVGSWAIWHDEQGLGIGKEVWGVLSGMLVIVTIIKPMLKLSDRIKAYTERMSEYHSVYIEALALADDVRANEGLDDNALVAEAAVAAKLNAIEKKSAEEDIDQGLIKRYEGVVRKQYPSTYFWSPGDKGPRPDQGEHATT